MRFLFLLLVALHSTSGSAEPLPDLSEPEVESDVALRGTVSVPGVRGPMELAGAMVEVHSTCGQQAQEPQLLVTRQRGSFTLSSADLGLADGRMACPVDVVAAVPGWSKTVRIRALPKERVKWELVPDDLQEPEPASPEVRGHVFVRNFQGVLVGAWGAEVQLGEPHPHSGKWCGGTVVTADGQGAFAFDTSVPCSDSSSAAPTPPKALKSDCEYLLRAFADSDWQTAESLVTARGSVQRVVVVLDRAEPWLPGDRYPLRWVE
jgi:hypothetical protein